MIRVGQVLLIFWNWVIGIGGVQNGRKSVACTYAVNSHRIRVAAANADFSASSFLSHNGEQFIR